MKQSESTFISAKIIWGTKDYTFSSLHWTHTVSDTQGCASKWIQIMNIHSKVNEFKIEQEKSYTHTYTHTKCWYTVRYLVSKFLHPSTELQGWTDDKSLNPRTTWCTPSIPTIRMRGFLSRIIMHTKTGDILNESEIVGTLRIFVKRIEMSSLWLWGYYTH
jgi:hypothetical protein